MPYQSGFINVCVVNVWSFALLWIIEAYEPPLTPVLPVQPLILLAVARYKRVIREGFAQQQGT
jgi:hypothetical protein